MKRRTPHIKATRLCNMPIVSAQRGRPCRRKPKPAYRQLRFADLRSLAVPLLEGLIGYLPFDKKLSELPTLRLALERHQFTSPQEDSVWLDERRKLKYCSSLLA